MEASPLSVRLQEIARQEAWSARYIVLHSETAESYQIVAQERAATLYEAARNEATRERFNARVERAFAELESGLR